MAEIIAIVSEYVSIPSATVILVLLAMVIVMVLTNLKKRNKKVVGHKTDEEIEVDALEQMYLDSRKN